MVRFGIVRSVIEARHNVLSWRDTLRSDTDALGIRQSDKQLQILVDLQPASARDDACLQDQMRAHGLIDNLKRTACTLAIIMH